MLKKYYIYLQTMFKTSDVELVNGYNGKYVFKIEENKYVEIENLGDKDWIMRGILKE